MITCIFDKITKKTNSPNGFDFGDTVYRVQNKGYNFPVICFKGRHFRNVVNTDMHNLYAICMYCQIRE